VSVYDSQNILLHTDHPSNNKERERERDGERGNGGGERDRTVLHKNRFLKNYREDI